MRAFVAFFKKEITESVRSGKLLILTILFAAFGIMNPAIAKLTPYLMELLSEEMGEIGMTVTSVEVDALTSWTQFFKNIPMALIAFVCIYGGIFAKEFESGTLVLMLTKGLARYKVALAKSSLLLIMWSAGYWLCFGITYGYNAYFWDNGIATGLMTAVFNWWLFGIFTVALMSLFSVVARGYSSVLLGTGAVVLASYLLSMIPKISKYLPTSLMNSAKLLVGTEDMGDYIYALAIAVALSVACIVASVPIFNKKQL